MSDMRHVFHVKVITQMEMAKHLKGRQQPILFNDYVSAKWYK